MKTLAFSILFLLGVVAGSLLVTRSTRLGSQPNPGYLKSNALGKARAEYPDSTNTERAVYTAASRRIPLDTDEHPSDDDTSAANNKRNSTEAMVELAASIRRREIRVKEKETNLAKQEKRLKILKSDLQKERQQVEALAGEAEAKVQTTRDLIRTLRNERMQLELEKNHINDGRTRAAAQLETARKEALDELARVFQSMTPEELAKTIMQYAESGELETMTRYLSHVDSDQASRAIRSIQNADLRIRLIEGIRQALEQKHSVPGVHK